MTPTNSRMLTDILDRHRRDGTRLMQILREAQEALGWLSPATITAIASGIGWPRAKVEGTASFYSFFHTRPMGEYRVLWSDNITDRMLGNLDLMQAMCQKLWLEPGRVSEDGLVSVDTTSCTGMCDQGPAVLVNYRAIPRMTRERVELMVELIRARKPLADWPADWFVIEDNIRRADILLGNRMAPGEALGAALAAGADAMLAEIRTSQLRGRGGAGFATGLKWEACRQARGTAHYVICNADEGEPGTFKDRVLLTRQPDLVFEGMTIAAHIIGARRGYVYLRGEYRYLLESLESVLAARRAAGLLGADILGKGFDFDIEIHLGAGAYVCGEESALIESLEGKRGVPRNRPPYPVTHGFLNQPTVVNNVETFAAAALIAARGGDWYRSFGTPRSAGTKILSVSGDCARPGVYEYPFGVSVRQVLADCGAHDSQAVQISGPSGICIGPDEFDRRIAFEDIPTAGAFMIFDIRRDIFDVVRNFIHFFAHESCGFCTPCRVGTTLLKNLMDKIAAGHGTRYDIDEIYQLNRVLRTAAHCGLGHTAANPLVHTLEKFRPAYERRLKSMEFEPAFDLDAALSEARQMTGRDDAGAHLATDTENAR
ncbi:MAG: NAD(P)H-dependent oxidoreductase subunit E [Rhodocyclaceae bacterium]|nr:NAD(P)H-dependent oxidoreductase subunit E [Rhodocyclaceae bacterium]MBK6553861.1 NAD(P)H-dependent oxidoreductase subunit E [Rhodocyclaceae bacterium]MBK9310861.1 NAD(P)H-dependent oxidoreductase subunit E [Rhodocyclaceae bacterium]MBK9954069.1 NAD(P)H-dependent oxidoreductase subunit E [Rhodocyclaceae bacterium]